MISKIPNLLNKEQLQKLSSIIDTSSFVDGRLTTVGPTNKIKNNLEMKRDDQTGPIVNQIVSQALAANSEFRNITYTRRMTPPIISLYKPGMEYREHTDAPLMELNNTPFRTDISTTIFLSDPDSYDGGALVLKSPFGTESYKLAAGDAVVYSTTMLHRIEPVTRGERVVVIFWCESLVRDAAKRSMLTDLNRVTGKVADLVPDSDESRILIQLYSNLLKMWADN